jgi:four helix bundle protein
MKDFKKLVVWQKGIELCRMVYCLTSTFPANEKLTLVSQMNRCAVFIPSNIAKGSSRRSEKDYFRFLEIALGSCYELETQCVLLHQIKIGDEKQINEVQHILDEEAMMIFALMKRMNPVS